MLERVRKRLAKVGRVQFVGITGQNEPIALPQSRDHPAYVAVGPKYILECGSELDRRPTVIDRCAAATDEFVRPNSAGFEVIFQRRVVNGGEAGVVIQVAMADEVPDGDAVIEKADDIAKIKKNGPHAVVI